MESKKFLFPTSDGVKTIAVSASNVESIVGVTFQGQKLDELKENDTDWEQVRKESIESDFEGDDVENDYQEPIQD